MRIYVGTYYKYNAGSIAGAWLDPEDYEDLDEFIEAAHKVHEDEDDPELMFQDHEGLPSRYYGESEISPELWEFLQLSTEDQEKVEAYWDCYGDWSTLELSGILDAYIGEYQSMRDYAEELYSHDVENASGLPEIIANNIDWEGVGEDLKHDLRYHESTGYLFNC